MPAHDSITLALHSQHDAAPLPEKHLSAHLKPAINNNGSNLTTVSIPFLPRAQFWLSLLIHPPPPPESDTKFLLFKIYATNPKRKAAEQHLLSFSLGAKEDWRGKIMHGFSAADETDFEGRKIVEKRGMFFGKGAGEGVFGGVEKGLEIKVFRARGRRKICAVFERVEEGACEGGVGGGVNLIPIGRVREDEKKRMYTYALLNPKDQPYVTFRYIFETKPPSLAHEHAPADQPIAAPSSRRLSLPDPSTRRLSIPPARKLVSTSSRWEPFSPEKKRTSDGYSTTREWIARTPSPMGATLFESPRWN